MVIGVRPSIYLVNKPKCLNVAKKSMMVNAMSMIVDEYDGQWVWWLPISVEKPWMDVHTSNLDLHRSRLDVCRSIGMDLRFLTCCCWLKFQILCPTTSFWECNFAWNCMEIGNFTHFVRPTYIQFGPSLCMSKLGVWSSSLDEWSLTTRRC